MKYIIIERSDGLEYPILFPEMITHRFMAQSFDFEKVISAGFVKATTDINNNVLFYTHGESISLKMKSRIEDGELIRRVFDYDNYTQS